MTDVLRPFKPPDPWPVRHIKGTKANYYLLDLDTIRGQRFELTSQWPEVHVFTRPYACVQGVVKLTLDQKDGDRHIYLLVDGSGSDMLVCEIVPQIFLPMPKVGDHIVVYGQWHYDAEHWWPEIHPVHHWEPA